MAKLLMARKGGEGGSRRGSFLGPETTKRSSMVMVVEKKSKKAKGKRPKIANGDQGRENGEGGESGDEDEDGEDQGGTNHVQYNLHSLENPSHFLKSTPW